MGRLDGKVAAEGEKRSLTSGRSPPPADINRNRWPTSARNDRPKSSESAVRRF